MIESQGNGKLQEDSDSVKQAGFHLNLNETWLLHDILQKIQGGLKLEPGAKL